MSPRCPKIAAVFATALACGDDASSDSIQGSDGTSASETTASIDAEGSSAAGDTGDTGEVDGGSDELDGSGPQDSSAGEDTGPPMSLGCTEGLPSAPGPHIAMIEALAGDTWLEIGAPAPDPTWGMARGRTWTSEMPFAPEFRGAFFTGEGVHGFVKPDGNYMDDLWFYDLEAHRWIACYPGAEVATLDLVINEDGFEAEADGTPLPVAQQVHGYELNTWDRDRHALLIWPTPGVYWEPALPQRASWYQDPPADASPWIYDTATGRFDRKRTGAPYPPAEDAYGALMFGSLVYVDSQQRAFLYLNSYPNEIWFYDPAAATWEQGTSGGVLPPFGIDATACYDESRDRIYMGGGSYPVTPEGTNPFWYYDLAAETWVDPMPAGGSAPPQSFANSNATMICDSVNDRVLVMRYAYDPKAGDVADLGTYAYDPTANTWAAEALAIPDAITMAPYPAESAFFDPALSAVFVYAAPDSGDEGATMWVYRTAGG